MSKAKLVLLDAHALIHRAYHAIPTDLLSPTGEPTKAVYGFTSTLLKVLKDVQPRYIAAAFDVGKSFRVEQFADYKANRPRLADDLRAQIARVRDVCAAFGIPIYAKEGYEADDLLGSLDRQAGEQGIETIIVTGDTDTFQLIDADTEVLTFTRQFGDMIVYDHDKIVERYGLEPVQLVDLKALRGDPSDNIPGVPGIGDKTATRLLQTYGTVENILSHLDEVDDKTAGRLEPNKEQITRSKELVTIDRSAPAVLDLEAARFDEFERDRVLALFRELGFQSLLSRLPETAGASQALEAATTAELDQTGGEDYHTVSTEAELAELGRELKRAGKFVVDVETTDLDELKADLVGIAIGVGDRKGYYVPVGHMAARHPAAAPAKKGGKKPQPALFDESSETIAVQQEPMGEPPPQVPLERVRAALAPLFGDRDIQKIAHNSKYDMIVLGEHGIETRGMAFDTLIAAHLLEPSGQRLGLKELAFAKFGVQMTEIEGLIGKGKNQIAMSEVTVEKAANYACADADYTFRLMELYAPQLAATGLDKLFYELEMPLVPVIIELERAGVLLDSAALGKFGEELDERLRGLEKQIYELCGAEFNLGSPVQLSDTLFAKLGLPSTHLDRTRSGQISTAAGVLEELRDKHPVIALILEHRELAKLKGTYVDALPELVSPRDGRLHTSFNQTGTVTGRISSSNPNLQNIPIKTELGRRVRRSFIAPPGSVILSADYSQVELRILAHVSKDENLLQAFADGEDIHASTAARLFNVPIEQVTSAQRRLGKTINFGVAYGISDRGVAGRTELNLEESRELINNYFAKFPRVREYMDRTKDLARSQGYVESLMGRRRYFPELAAGRRVPINVRNQAEREAINMPIQASAADIIKRAMVDLYRALNERGYKSRMILQVHDELVLECPREEVAAVAPLVCEFMEHAYTLDAPLKVDVVAGPNWDEMKPVET